MRDIVIFTNGNIFSRVILDKFILKYESRISMVVIVTGDYYGNSGSKALLKFAKHTSLFYVFYKIWTLIMIKLLRMANVRIVSSVSQLCESLNVSYITTSSINDDNLYEKIKQHNSSYLISVSCPQLIKKKWLDLFKGRGMNIHSSLLPRYGGLAPYFWVLVKNEKETGISIHYLIKGFDKGNILAQSKTSIEKGISAFRLFFDLCIKGSFLMVEAFQKLEIGDPGMLQDSSKFTYHSHPTTPAYFRLKRNGYSLFNRTDFAFARNYLKELSSRFNNK